MIFVALGLLLLGVLIGTTGMKRLGRMLRGTWRPGAAVLALISFGAGLLLLMRAAWLEGVLLLGAGVVLTLSARQRPAGASPAVTGMDKRSAASILGVEADADAAQIEEAYRRLIRRAHPDHGGSPGLAAQLNAARSAMSQSPARRGRTSGRGAETSG